jgi:Ca-activated chloride channel family protein
LVATTLVATILPSTHAARGQRPRRVADAPQTTPKTTPTPRPTATPNTVAAPATNSPSPRATPAVTLQTRPETSDPTPSPTPDDGQEVDEDDVVKVEANLINLQVRVIDRNNRPINDIRKDEFRVFENGVQQTIEFFTREEVPISYGLVVDNSGSLRSQLAKVIEAGRTIVNSNKPGDEAMVVRFIDSEKIEELQSFTAKQEDLLDALETFHVDGGQTAVVDAVYVSAERIAQHKKGDPLNDRRRRALILVTDGEDRGSQYKQEQLFNALREMDVQIFVIGFVNELDKEGGFIRKSPRDKAVDLINRLAKETGGRAFFPTSNAELPQIAEEITRDLRTQFVISYKPTEKARAGEYRNVRVTVADVPGRDKRIAITRAGYTAPRISGNDAPAATPNNGNRPPASSNTRTNAARKP